MNSLIASLLALVFVTGAIPPTDPALEQLCMNPAYRSMHQTACANAVNPPNYHDHNHNRH